MGITIEIKHDSKGNLFAKASGSIEHVITDEDRKKLGLDDDTALNQIVKQYKNLNREPDATYLKDPTTKTRGGNLYATKGKKQVSMVLIPKSAKIRTTGIKSIALKTHKFVNDSKTKSVTQSTTLEESVSNTSSSTWSCDNRISVTEKISVKVALKVMEASAETSLGYEHTWGKSETLTQDITFKTASTIEVTLEPGERLQAILTASESATVVDVEFKAYLDGTIIAHFDKKKYENSDHTKTAFFYIPVRNLIDYWNRDVEYDAKETIELGYYSNGKSETVDIDNKITAVHALCVESQAK